MGVDRFGEVDRTIELGEVDQEQHDGVRDVFVLPSACMLVRADLFRELGGFDEAMTFHGEDVELCWRIHHSGARVVVTPSARVRHRGDLVARRPDLHHERLKAQHRMRTVAALTGGSRLPGRSIEMVLLDRGRTDRRRVHRHVRSGMGIVAGARRVDPAHPIGPGQTACREAVPPGPRTGGRRSADAGGVPDSPRSCAAATPRPTCPTTRPCAGGRTARRPP